MEQDHVAKQKRYSAQPTQRTARSGGPGRPRWARGRRLLVLLAAIALGMAVIFQTAARAGSGPPLPLRTTARIPLAGRGPRPRYQGPGPTPPPGEAGTTQYDPVSRRMFVDVQTLNQLVAINPATDRIVARYALPTSCQHDHSLLIDAPHRLAFIACDGNARLLVFDLTSLRVTSVQTVGDNPDVLAFDGSMQRLYVAAESGIVAVFTERRRTLHQVAEGFVATEAHVIALDPPTHRLYLPLQDVDGKPVLRVALLR